MRARNLFFAGLASVLLVASGLDLEDLRRFEDLHVGQMFTGLHPPDAADPDTADDDDGAPPISLNLGDCLRQTDRSQWPPAYAAICKDLRSGIETAPAEKTAAADIPVPARAISVADVPVTDAPVANLRPAPIPIAKPLLHKIALAEPRAFAPVAPPPPSCVIGATGQITIGDGKAAHMRPAHLISASPVGRSPAGLALGVPTACDLMSPAAGKIVFAGEFQGYRGVVIVELPQGRRLVIAGLGPLRVQRGQRIMRGDILGASAQERAPALATAFGGDDASLVFFDLRNRKGRAEPLPWFAEAS